MRVRPADRTCFPSESPFFPLSGAAELPHQALSGAAFKALLGWPCKCKRVEQRSLPVDLPGTVRQVALEILAYLAKHPEAKDTLEGVRQWWLEDPDRWSERDISSAAQALVDRGLLRVWELSPGSAIFGPTGHFLRSPQKFVREFAGQEPNGSA